MDWRLFYLTNKYNRESRLIAGSSSKTCVILVSYVSAYKKIVWENLLSWPEWSDLSQVPDKLQPWHECWFKLHADCRDGTCLQRKDRNQCWQTRLGIYIHSCTKVSFCSTLFTVVVQSSCVQSEQAETKCSQLRARVGRIWNLVKLID